MRTYQTEDGVNYSIDISYSDFARSVFETEDDPQVYDRKLDHLESTVMDLGETPTDAFFDNYQQARSEVDQELPDFDANILHGDDGRTGKMTYLNFTADEEPDNEEAFVQTIDEALTETLAATVATWYDAARQASEYRDKDLTLQVTQEDGVHGTYFSIDTAPDADSDVMEHARDLMHAEPDLYEP